MYRIIFVIQFSYPDSDEPFFFFDVTIAILHLVVKSILQQQCVKYFYMKTFHFTDELDLVLDNKWMHHANVMHNLIQWSNLLLPFGLTMHVNYCPYNIIIKKNLFVPFTIFSDIQRKSKCEFHNTSNKKQWIVMAI